MSIKLLKTASKDSENHRIREQSAGFSIVEVLIVVVIIGILSAIAIPQFAARRAHRMAGIPREIVTQIRFARQQALAQRQAFTVRLDFSSATNRRLVVIDTNDGVSDTGALLTATADTVVRSVPLGGAGLPSAALAYGIPPTVSAAASTLSDGAAISAMPAGGIVDITFCPDGSVRDGATNLPVSPALFFYDSGNPTTFAYAISVLGAAGRVRAWKYNSATQIYARD